MGQKLYRGGEFMAWFPRTLLLLALLTVLLPPTLASAESDVSIHVLTLKGIINPPAANYVKRGIRQAQDAGAHAVVLQLDTPGGLDASMREIIQPMVNATLPVIVYVAPQGARAASAGTFIAMAAHVAAMAPGTTIGSATPVTMGSSGEVRDVAEDLRNKVVNEAVSYIRDLAERRGRNADWAERAVREGANLPSSEAVEQGVVELVARDLRELLAEVHGMEVELATGERVVLDTASATVRRVDMTLMEQFLHTISDPNIAFILLSLAMLGLFLELSSPGAILPGVAGGIALLLALYSLGTLDAYWGGVLLVVLAFGLLVAEIFIPSYGVLGVGAVIALMLGALMLFTNAPEAIQISPWVMVVTGATTAALFLFFLRAIVVSRRRNLAPMGYHSLIGAVGVARTELVPEGTVFVQGERWHGISAEDTIEPGEAVVVERVEGMNLWVSRKKGA